VAGLAVVLKAVLQDAEQARLDDLGADSSRNSRASASRLCSPSSTPPPSGRK